MSRSRFAQWRGLLMVLLATMWLSLAGEAMAKPRRQTKRFAGRMQTLSGVALAVPTDADGQRHFVSYVPVDVELAFQVSGLLSVAMGGVGYLAPFNVTTCSAAPSTRPNALGAFLGVRFDFNNTRDGSWWSPWVALRGGVVGQNGVPDGSPCVERFLPGLFLSPRLGIDLWMGHAAVTFAVGYDELPRASAFSAQVGLTVRLF